MKNSELMWKQSVWSSVIAGKIAATYLKEGGFLSLTGAKAAFESTPGNSSVHQGSFLELQHDIILTIEIIKNTPVLNLGTCLTISKH